MTLYHFKLDLLIWALFDAYLFVDLVALSNGLHGSVQMDWVALNNGMGGVSVLDGMALNAWNTHLWILMLKNVGIYLKFLIHEKAENRQ